MNIIVIQVFDPPGFIILFFTKKLSCSNYYVGFSIFVNPSFSKSYSKKKKKKKKKKKREGKKAKKLTVHDSTPLNGYMKGSEFSGIPSVFASS